MTTTPISGRPTEAVLAVLSGATDPSGTSAPGGAADFLVAILQALAPGAAAGTDAGSADATGTGAGTDSVAADAAALGLVVPGLVAPAGAGQVAGAAGGQPAAPGRAGVAAVTAGAPTGPTGTPAYAGVGTPPETPSTAGQPLAPGHAIVAGGTDAAPSGPTGDIRMPGSASGGSPTSGPTPGSATAAATADPAAPHGPDADPAPAAGPAAPSAAPVAGPQPPAPAAPPEVRSADQVTRQVFPEVTSLTSRGDGTHRITLSLKPEALGEVRVVMTVREGVVHVRLAAGHEAQRALLEGSPELTRLLEATGASETRIVVRDLGTSTATTAGTPGLSQGLGDPRPQDQHAGTRAEHPATDGTNDTRTARGTAGPSLPRSDEPVTRTRTAGVDVTM